MFPVPPHIQSNSPATNEKINFKDLSFRNGETFKAAVIKRYSEREVLIAAKGRQFRANTIPDLKEGKTYYFQVNKTGSKIELKVADGLLQRTEIPIPIPTSPAALKIKLASILVELSKIPHFKGLSNETLMCLNNLRQILPMMIYSDPVKNSSLWLSRFIGESGIFWENKVLRHLLGEKIGSSRRLPVSDLKGLLLSLDRCLESEARENDNIQSFTARIKQAVGIIEHEQLLNLASLKEGMGWFFFIPGYGEKSFQYAEVSMKNRKDEKGFLFTIAMEFTRLGKIDIEVSIMESNIGMRVHMEDPEKVSIINDNIHFLKTGLNNLGFAISSIHCDVGDGNEEEKNLFFLEQDLVPKVDLII